MKIKQNLVFLSMLFISLLAIGAVCAADDAGDVVGISEADVQAIDNVDECVALDDSANDNVLQENSFNMANFGNGTGFNMGNFGNGTGFNMTGFGGNGSGNGSFNMADMMGGMMGGKQITFNASDINKAYTGPTTFKNTIQEGGKPVAGKDVIFTLNGKDVVARTDKNGTAIFKKDLKPGTYKIYTEYNNEVSKNQIVIKKGTSKIAASAKTFKANVENKYVITLKNSKGKAIKNVKVTLKINGKTLTAKTNSIGKATFKLAKLTTGKYTAAIKFAGNGYYKASNANKKITIQ